MYSTVHVCDVAHQDLAAPSGSYSPVQVTTLPAGSSRTQTRTAVANKSIRTHSPRIDAPRVERLERDPRRYGVRAVAPAGAYRGVAAWHSRDVWLAAVRDALADGAVPLAYTAGGARDSISPDTFLRLLEVHVAAADHATGRGIDLTIAQVMKLTGETKGTVKRFRRIARRAARLLAMITHARVLRMFEAHGLGRAWIRDNTRTPDGAKGRQRGIPSLWAAKTPRWLRPYIHAAHARLAAQRVAAARQIVDNSGVENTQVTADSVDCVTQPSRATTGGAILTSRTTSPSGHSASLRSAKQPRSARRLDKRGRRLSRQQVAFGAGQRLARDLAARLPWARNLNPRDVAHCLRDLALAGWTATDWTAAADRILAARGAYGWTTPDHVASPAGYIVWLTSQMTPDPDDANPDAGRDIPHDADEFCARPDCDHGWIDQLHPDGSRTSTRCPNTHPADDADDTWDEDEPPF